MDYAATIGSPSFVRLSSWRDNLVNFINSLGTAKDPTTQSQYYFRELDRFTLENAYRSDWIARIVIDAPAEDATREWRNWQASGPQIEALEEVENGFKLQQKVKQWIQRARLYGGAALVLGVDDGRESWEEVNLDGVKKDGLQFVVVMNRYELMAGPRIYNVSSPWYTRPEFYTVSTPLFGFYGEPGGSAPGSPYAQGVGMPLSAGLTNSLYARPYGQTPPAAGGGQSNVVRLSRGPAGGFGGDPYKQVTPPFGMIRLHPSRVVELAGNELPDWRLAPMGGGWGDSVLQTVDESLKDWGLTVGSIANMTNDAKTDVVKIKDFTQKVQTAEYKQKLLDRWMVANLSKSTVNALLLDTEEEWQRIQTSFGGLAELMREYMVVISGATGIPISRLFGQSSGRGLGAGSSGGEQDMVNYYDRISQWQRNTVKPAMTILDQVLIRSTFGKPIKSVHYDWAPLWQMSAAEKGKVWESKAHVYQIDVQQGLINEDALRRARINQLVEDGVYPGLEAAIDEFGEEPDIPEARMWSPAMGIDPNTGKPVGGGGGPPGGPGAPPGAPPGAKPPPQGGQPKPPVPPPGGAAQAKLSGNGKATAKDAAPSDYGLAMATAEGIEDRPKPEVMTGAQIFAELTELERCRATMKVRLTELGLNALSPTQIEEWHSDNSSIVADKAFLDRQQLLKGEADIRAQGAGFGLGGDYAWLCSEPFVNERRVAWQPLGDDFKPDQPRDPSGKWTSAAGGSGVPPAGLSKTTIVKHLLTQPGGTTTAEILKHTGWTAVTVPGHAAKHGLELSKTKNAAGETVYKGTPKEAPSPANKESDIKAAAHAMSPKAAVAAETHVAAAAAAPSAGQSPTLAGQQIKGFENADKWEKVGGQTGSNPGGTYKDEQGQHWYVKTPPTADHAMNEVLTGKLYKLAGANVPETKLVGLGNKVSVASKMLPGAKTLNTLQTESGKATWNAAASKDFAADAWLGNRDSVGLAKDNMVIAHAPDEKPGEAKAALYRIDHGGGMQYRAQGEAKEFGSNPTEFHTLRDPAYNKQAADVFGKMTNADLAKSINKVTEIPDHVIDATVKSVYSGQKAADLANTLVARKEALAKEGAIAAGKPPPGEEAKAAAAEPVKTPEPAPAKAPQATQAELTKAAKTTPMPMGLAGPSPAAQKVVSEFNEKWSGKTITDPEQLNQKVAEYKEAVSKVQAAAAAHTASQQKPASTAQPLQAPKTPTLNSKQSAHAQSIGVDTSDPKQARDYAAIDRLTNNQISSGHFNSKIQNGTKLGMTPLQAMAISAYTGSHYDQVNDPLRKNALTDDQIAFFKHADAGLQKVPVYQGQVIRGTSLTPEAAARYVPGMHVREDAFMSTGAGYKFGGNTYFTVQSLTGRDIRKINPGEHEVLFPANTYFKVLKNEMQGGTRHIHLSEYD